MICTSRPYALCHQLSSGADVNSIVHVGQVIAKLDRALFTAVLAESQAWLGEPEKPVCCNPR